MIIEKLNFQYDRRLARAAHIRSWRRDLEFELDRERREDYENELSSVKRRAVREQQELVVEATQSVSERLKTDRTEEDPDTIEDLRSRRSKTSRTSTDRSLSKKQGNNVNSSEQDRLLSGRVGTSNKAKSMYADSVYLT